ncbi:PREDICTED: uncharacterized protein LOC108618454 [Drosophila arizonae]|uniref:Uncharacterized protein LOC108618454 n=1 Tax=Drosophila arizonae TaxID=7263 RepID=A0ABM1PT20_DROAR|nr:PREDICTED: uncharacterized protein LOC108618454 [Drosophila arizonae]
MAVTNLPRVPDGLRDLVKTYTKEVLREKPKDLYKFSVDYFENLAGTRKIQRKVMKYESQQSYETIMKNRIRQQIPLSLAFHIIPENLTEVIKQFIKAVLRENPQYLVLFAIDYFKNLQASSSKLGNIQYTAYEKFVEKNESKSPARKVTKCECGRILSSTGGRPEVIQNDTPDVDQQIEKFHKNDQYIKAVYIIQKYFRQYLKQKAEKSSQVKVTSKSADIYGSQEVLNAILIIQRQFRRLIIKKRSKVSAETKQTNEGQLNETEDKHIDKHFGTKTCDELEKSTTDDDISKNLQLEKIGHDENIKNISIEESTNPLNIDILEPEQHQANTIQFTNEILSLETTSDLGNQNSATTTAVSSSGSNSENVATTHADLFDDENRNETQFSEHSEKHLLKTDEFKKSSIIKSESLNDDNRIFESAQTIEMDGVEDHNVITSNNVTKESIPESSSKIQSLESLPESEKIRSPSGSDMELVSKITTELKASSESLKTSLLSTDILDLEQNVDQKPLDSIITTLEERSADLSSKATKHASLESNYDKSANQNHPISPTLKSVEKDNENLINQITDDIINNNPSTNQVNDTVDENINKLTTVAEIPVDSQILTVNNEINSDAITNSQINNGSDKINSDAVTENTVNENEKTEESKVDPGNIIVEESLTKSSFQESLESTEYENIKTLEPSNSLSPIDKQNSEIPTDAITQSTVKETKDIKSNPSNILKEESLTKSSIQERLESQEYEKKKSASTITTDIVDQEQRLDQNKITNISSAAPDYCQNESTETKNTQSLESANDDIGDQVN